MSCTGKYSIDLLICDANYASNQSGSTVINEARKRNLVQNSCVVFALTSETENEHIRTILDSGVDDYATKPYSLFGLKRQLKRTSQKKLFLKELYELDFSCPAAEIEEKFAQTYKLFPDLVEDIDRLKGEYFISVNNYRSALVHFKKGSLKYKSSWPTIGLATCLIQSGDNDRAENYLNVSIESTDIPNPQVLDALAHVRFLKGNLDGGMLCLTKSDELAKGNLERLECKSIVGEALGLFEQALVDYQAYSLTGFTSPKGHVSTQVNFFRLQLQGLSAGDKSQWPVLENKLRLLEKSIRFENDKLAVVLVKAHFAILENNRKSLRSFLSVLLKSLDRLDASCCWYLLNLLYLANEDYWFEKVLAHYERVSKRKQTHLAHVCENIRLNTLKEQSEKRRRSLTEAIDSIRQIKVDNISEATLSAIGLSQERLYCVSSAISAVELLAENFPKNVSRQLLRQVITNSEQLIVYSISLRNSDKEQAVSLLKKVKQKFNQLVSVTE